MKLIRGVAYYPEFWPEERWETDFRMMRDIGLNLVRIGEFAWPSFEPEEGRFTLDWLARLLDLAAKHEIEVLMCTPSACPPKWLTNRHPDTRLVLPSGQVHGDYVRKQYCPNSPKYREFVLRIAEKLADVTLSHGRVRAWQIDNELGPHECGRCFCPTCAAKFREWLQAKYGTLDELNARWQTNYWGQRVAAWPEIELPVHRNEPSVNLDFCRFYHDSVVEFFAAQKRGLQAAGVKAPITTNFMGPVYEGLDYWQFAQKVDRVAYDLYMGGMNAASIALGLDIFRNLKNDFFWLTETGTQGQCARHPDESEVRLWFYTTFARGSRGHVFFRWRTCLAGHEQNHPSMLTHGARRNRGADQAAALFREVHGLERELGLVPLPHCDTAIIMDWQSVLAAASPTEFRPGAIARQQNHLTAMYEWLLRRGLNVDVVSPSADLSKCKLVLLPGSLNLARNADLAQRLCGFARQGGTVVATATLFCTDSENNYYVEPRPDGLTDLFGLSVGETRATPTGGSDTWDRPVAYVHVAAGRRRCKAGEWLEELVLQGASVLARYADGFLKGQAAVTANRYGEGMAFYVGTVAGEDLMSVVLERACKSAGVAALKRLPEGVEYVNCRPYHFFLNSNATPRRVMGAPAGRMLIGRRSGKAVAIAPYGICLIKEERKQ